MKDSTKIEIKWWHLVIVIAVPIAVNVICSIPLGIVVGNGETWVGFFANYSGGLIGGFLTILIANSQAKLALRQIEDEKIKKEIEENERKQTGLEIIKMFLYDEMKINLDKIGKYVFEGLQEKTNGTTRSVYVYRYQGIFIYNTFNELKYEIVRDHKQDLHKAIDLYRSLKLLEQYTEIQGDDNKGIPKDVAEFTYKSIAYWKDYFEKNSILV